MSDVDTLARDPDIALITDYLAGALDASSTKAVERRLEEDAVFFDKVWPLVRAWRLEQSFRAVGSTARRSKIRRLAPILVAAAVLVFVVQELPRAGVHFGRPPRGLPVLAPEASIATGPGETREVLLADSTRVVLRPRSTFSYSRAVGAGAAVIARIRGEAVFEVARASSPVTVETRAGMTRLAVGRYAIRCAEGAREMLVTVQRGTAMLYNLRSTISGWLTLGSGQYGRVRENALPTRDSGAGFPQPQIASDDGH